MNERAVILGDLSGLQGFLFAVAAGQGGQAKRLRARSFYLQMVTEVAAQRLRVAAGWSQNAITFCAACKCLLTGPALSAGQLVRVEAAARGVAQWLWQHTSGQLTFACTTASGEGSIGNLWHEAAADLHRQKAAPAADVLIKNRAWDSGPYGCLVLPAVDISPDNTPVVPGDNILNDREIGRRLPDAAWAIVALNAGQQRLAAGEFLVCNARVKLSEEAAAAPPAAAQEVVYSLARPPQGNVRACRLSRYVPRAGQNRDGDVLDFADFASESTGDQKLGVLCMDVDRLGQCFQRLQQEGDGTAAVTFSTALHKFFATDLDNVRRNEARFQFIYTLFSGGDDLIAAGPWDAVLDYAARVQREFAAHFGGADRLTISAGMVMVRPKLPIARAVELAQAKLAQAKGKGGDRIAALGDLWTWRDHERLNCATESWWRWIKEDVPRGTLQRFISFGESLRTLHGDPDAPPPPADTELTPAQMAYHISRNIKHHDAKAWCLDLLRNLTPQNPCVRYLAVIARWATALTRSIES